MQVTAKPTRIGIIVMRNPDRENAESTIEIRDKNRISLAKWQEAFVFRPILECDFEVQGETTGLMSIVKFQYFRNNQLVWSQLQPQMFHRPDKFYPDINLPPRNLWREHGAMWKVVASMRVIYEAYLTGIASNQLITYLNNLPYTVVAHFQWEVAESLMRQLTSTGEARRPQDLSMLQQVTMNVEDI